MKKISMAGTLVAICLTAGGAWAQNMPVYESTGTVELVIDGDRSTHHTTFNTVPNQPGRRVDTARWRLSAPMMMGGINIAPPGVLVTLSSRPAIEPHSSLPELKITFSLDENDHALLKSPPFQVSYIVKEGPLAGEYQHASGALQILSVTSAGDDVLKITGRAAGTLDATKKDRQGSGAGLGYAADFSVDAYRF